MKIAIIGSGISGLGAAWLLNKKYDITLFEKNDYCGGHANTAQIDYFGKKIAVDTGFIVYNFRTYHNLKPFFEHLGVDIEKSNMSFGVTNENGLEYSGNNISSLFAQRKNIFNPRFWRMLFDIVKFNKNAIRLVEQDFAENITLEQFIKSLNLGSYFKKYYLLPMAAAIWSCPMEMMKNYPAKTFLRFFYNHGLLTITNQPQWYTVTGGSKEYVKKVMMSFSDKIKSNCAIKKAVQKANGKILLFDENNKEYEFDQVIFACHADEALEILENPTKEEKAILSKFKYSKNLAVLHRDEEQMPKNKKAWASWIYLSCAKEEKISLTYFMNNLQNIDQKFPLFVTLNPLNEINEEKVFGKYQYRHPIFDLEAISAQERLKNIQGKRNIWFCGAWTRYGFHEDGLLSAVEVAKEFGVKTPW